jgi:hypothetical protein
VAAEYELILHKVNVCLSPHLLPRPALFINTILYFSISYNVQASMYEIVGINIHVC